MEEIEIIKVLNRYNPWWDNKPIPESKTSPFRRGDFYEIRNSIEKREIAVCKAGSVNPLLPPKYPSSCKN